MSALELAAELGSLYVLSVVSGVIWVANAEATAAYYGAERGWNPLLIALVCTAGQATMFSTLFLAGGRILPRWPWFARQVERTRARFGERLAGGFLTTTASASLVGVPPLAAMAALADGFSVPFARFLAIVVALRFLRFWLFAAAGAQLTEAWQRLWS